MKFLIGVTILTQQICWGFEIPESHNVVPGQVNLGNDTATLQHTAGSNYNCAHVIQEMDDGGVIEGIKCFGRGGPWLGYNDYVTRGDDRYELGSNLTFVLQHQLALEPKILKITAGVKHTCMLTKTYQVTCWGKSNTGATGTRYNNAVGPSMKSVDLGDQDTNVIDIKAGGYHNCALFDNGRLKCWGENKHGQLGLGTTIQRGRFQHKMGNNLPFVDLGTDAAGEPLRVKQFALGLSHSCAVFQNYKVKCWGMNQFGQLGVGDMVDRGTAPSQMGNALPYIDVYPGQSFKVVFLTLGKYHSCAISMNTEVRCWGYNMNGELGAYNGEHQGGTPEGMNGPNVQLPWILESESPVSIDAGFHHTCAIFSNGRPACWGSNDHGQLGIGDTGSRGLHGHEMGPYLPFVKLPRGLRAIDISCGEFHTCVTLSNNAPYCWGRNHMGQLGLGDVQSRGDEPGELPPGRGFSIEFVYGSTVTDDLKMVFESAAEIWRSLITSDHIDFQMSTIPFPISYLCNDEDTDAILSANYFIDDLVIAVEVFEVDGVGGELGYGTNCLFAPDTQIDGAPVHARIGFLALDEEDVDSMKQSHTLETFISHEIGHVLGIGTMWDFHAPKYQLNLLDDSDFDNPVYKGTGGIAGLANLGGSGNPHIDANDMDNYGWFIHWDEEEYGNELMTSVLYPGTNPLSELTARSLLDLGLRINDTFIESYTLPQNMRRRVQHQHKTILVNDFHHNPIKVAMLSRTGEFTPPTQFP